jgi:hypothetical protein
MDDKRKKILGSISDVLIHSGVGWLPKTDEEWAAAEVLFKTDPKLPKQMGRPIDTDDYWWTILWCALVLQSGLADGKDGKPKKERAFLLTAEAMEDASVTNAVDEKAIEKRWYNDKNPFRDFDFAQKDPLLTAVIEEFINRWHLQSGFKKFFPDKPT